jgi:hypothetical protein
MEYTYNTVNVQGQLPSVHVKSKLNNDIRRFYLSEPNYAALEGMVRKLYCLSDTESVVLKYRDDENELVTFSSDGEFEIGVSLSPKLLLVYVCVSASDSTCNNVNETCEPTGCERKIESENLDAVESDSDSDEPGSGCPWKRGNFHGKGKWRHGHQWYKRGGRGRCGRGRRGKCERFGENWRAKKEELIDSFDLPEDKLELQQLLDEIRNERTEIRDFISDSKSKILQKRKEIPLIRQSDIEQSVKKQKIDEIKNEISVLASEKGVYVDRMKKINLKAKAIRMKLKLQKIDSNV